MSWGLRMKLVLILLAAMWLTGSCETYTELGRKGYQTGGQAQVTVSCDVTCKLPEGLNCSDAGSQPVVVAEGSLFRVTKLEIVEPEKLQTLAQKSIDESIANGELNIMIGVDSFVADTGALKFTIISADVNEDGEYVPKGDTSEIDSTYVEADSSYSSVDETIVVITVKIMDGDIALPLSRVIAQGQFTAGGDQLTMNLDGAIREDDLDPSIKALVTAVLGDKEIDTDDDGEKDAWAFKGSLTAAIDADAVIK